MKKSIFILFLISSVFLIPAFSISHGASPSGYSEGLNVYVAGSSALWSLSFQGANSTQGISQVESQSGLTSYTLTAIKTSNAVSDFQVFFQDGYGVVNLPFVPTQGIFLTVSADSGTTSDKVAASFNDYLSTSFVQVSSAGVSTTYFSPIDFNTLAAPQLFKLIPSGMKGFTSVFTQAQFLRMFDPMIVVYGVRGSSGFTRVITLSGMSSSVLLSGKLQFQKMLGLTGNASISSSSLAGTSTVNVHVLDGYVASADPAQVANNVANLSGSYSYSAPLGRKVSPNVTVAQDIPVISALRILDRGSAQQGDTISVTLTIKNTAVAGTATNVAVDDGWWKAYPGLQLSRGNSSFKVDSLQPGKDYTNTYVLSVNSSAKAEITIPPVAVSFTYPVGTVAFSGRSVFNQAQIRLNDVGPAMSIVATSDKQSGAPLGLATHFFVTVTNLGNGPALSLQVLNLTRSSLAQGGASWTFNVTMGYSSLAQRNLTKFFNLQWQTSTGKAESLSSNGATLLFSHINMLIPFAQASANATIPQITGSVKKVNVTYDFANRGTVNGSAAHGSVAVPPGLACARQNFTSASCQGNSLSVDLLQLNTKFPAVVTAALNVTKPDNYVILPMELTTRYMNLTLHAWSSPVALPVGLGVTKTFSPSSLFPHMSSSVSVAISNLGSRALYNASFTSPEDAFDTISATGGANSKSFSPLAPQGQYSFSYAVTVRQTDSGNVSVAPVVVSLIFAGSTQTLIFGQNSVQILGRPSLSVTTTPASPVEGSTFIATIRFSNPAPVSLSSVHAVIPLPSGLNVVNPPSGVSVSGQSLTVDQPALAPRSNYAVNVTLKSSMGVILDLTKATLSFSYQGSKISGTVPNAVLTVNEDVTSRYIEPVVLGLFVLLFFVVIIRRRVSAAPTSPPKSASQKQTAAPS